MRLWRNSSLSKFNVQIAGKSFCVIFDALKVSYYKSAIVVVKKQKKVKWASNSVKEQVTLFLK